MHFLYQPQPNTDFTLGDCSYLESCRHVESCKYVHYQIDPEDIKRHHSKLQRHEKYTGVPQNPSSEKKHFGWVEFQDKSFLPKKLDQEILQQLKIENLKKNGAQWINCDLQTFDLEGILGTDYDVLTVDPPWDIHMTLPYDTMSDQQMIQDLKGLENLQ